MDILIELDYTPEFLQSCIFNVDVLAYELADYRHIGFHSAGEDFDINAYIFINRVWTFGMYASYEEVNFMFYNGHLVREFFTHEGYAGQTIRCCDLYISILGSYPYYRIFVKNYMFLITINEHNTEILREAIKSKIFPSVFCDKDGNKYIDGIINMVDNECYIKDIIIYDDVLPDSQLAKHDFKFELIED